MLLPTLNIRVVEGPAEVSDMDILHDTAGAQMVRGSVGGFIVENLTLSDELAIVFGYCTEK